MQCYGCKRFQLSAFANPLPGNLPIDRTEGTSPFQVVGVDYTGPIKYCASKNREEKGRRIVSFTRAALHLELTKAIETEEVHWHPQAPHHEKRRPERIYSDNGKTLVVAAKWLRNVMKAECLYDLLAKINVRRQFNFSRAPWLSGGGGREPLIRQDSGKWCTYLGRNSRCPARCGSNLKQLLVELRRRGHSATHTGAEPAAGWPTKSAA